jgi:hypothetical protein
MKNSIKISVIALGLLSFLSIHSNAQTTKKTESYGSGIRLSIGADGGIPVGSLKDNYDWNFGGSIQGDFPIIKDQLYATVNGGYNNFFSKNSSNLNDIHMIPVKGGLKYFPLKYLYIQGEAGASFITNKNDLGFSKSAVFVYAPQAGVLFNVGGKNYIDAGVRFEGNSKFYDGGKTNNFLALRVAYAFNL